MQNSDNKLVVVSGGSKGIGKAILMKFASEGFDVITCSSGLDNLAKLKDDILFKYPTVQVHTFQADLGIKDEAFAFVDFVNKLNRPIDVLVNNAGLFLPGTIHDEREGNLEFLINANLMSAYHLTRGLIGQMKESKSGHIFFMASTASIMAYPNGGSYCVSKFAMHGFAKVIREEMKHHGVRVTSVMPGATFTSSWEGAGMPEGRFMKSEDVADVVFNAYSISDRAVVEELIMRPQLGDL